MQIRYLLPALLMLTPGALAQPVAPYLPVADAVVLQKVPPAADPSVRQIEMLRAQVLRDPRDARAADALAHAYIDFGRRVGDAHYAGYAEAVIAPWMTSANPPPPLIVTQATILQYRHDFARARALLDKAVAEDPRLAQAWLTLAALDMVQGDYASAASHCSQAGKHGGLALGLACSANLRLNTGQAEQGLALLARIDADAAGLAPSFKAWIHGLRAEGAERLGRSADAEASYRRALAAAPGDNFLLCAYADFLLDRGRAKGVLALLDEYADSDTAFLRLAVAHTALRSSDASRYRWVMAARFEAYRQRGDDSFGREEARFLLQVANEPDAALAAALRNFDRQKEAADARLVLEAAQAAKQPRAAAPVVAFVTRSKLSDARIDALVLALTKDATS